MIYCDLAGQLGNCIYAIFNSFYLCDLKNINYNNIIIDANYVNKHDEGFYIKNRIEFFYNIKEYLIDDYKKKRKGIPLYKINDLIRMENVPNDFAIKIFHWVSPSRNLRLLKKLFYNEQLFNNIKNKYNFDGNDCIGIHVRRCDWPKYCDIEEIYCKIDKMYNNEKIIVFSDDIDWCKNNIKKYNNIVYMDNHENYEDMILLSACKKICPTTTSTFSECAIFLNKCKEINNE